MILIGNDLLNAAALAEQFEQGSTERAALDILRQSDEVYTYETLDELQFELRLRAEIVKAATALGRSRMDFAVFRDSRANERYWSRRADGGFVLRRDVSATEAVHDIFEHGSKYATECATAMQIVYVKALMEVLPRETFDRVFRGLVLMNWHDITPVLRETGRMRRYADYLPGDRRYFTNPDVDPETPEWQGENVIDLGGGRYYGHGIGTYDAETIVRALNGNRHDGDDVETAYLMDAAGRPNFRRLAALRDPAVLQSESAGAHRRPA